jgi:hypothetical protein
MQIYFDFTLSKFIMMHLDVNLNWKAHFALLKKSKLHYLHETHKTQNKVP